MRPVHFFVLAFLLATPAMARPRIGTGIVISLMKPDRIVLEAGGAPVEVRFFGEGFDAVTEVHVWRNGQRDRSLEVDFSEAGRSMMQIRLKAPRDAGFGEGYQLVLVTRKWSERLPLPVKVLDPDAPPPPRYPEFDEPERPREPGSWFEDSGKSGWMKD